MKKVTVTFDFTAGEWEVLKERAKKAFPDTQKEIQLLGYSYSLEDAIDTELKYIVSKDLETYGVYDLAREDIMVTGAIRKAISSIAKGENNGKE